MVSICVGLENNFSFDLVSPHSVEGPVGFTLKEPSWVYFHSSSDGKLEVRDSFGKQFLVVLRDGDGFFELPAGVYHVSNQWSDSLRIRKVGVTLYYSIAGTKFDMSETEMVRIPTNPREGGRAGMYLYSYQWLRKHILGPFNMVANGRKLEVKQWQSEGRKQLFGLGLGVPETLYENWCTVVSKHCTNGILLDEFIVPAGQKDTKNVQFGYTSPGRGFDDVTQDSIKKFSKKFPNQRFCAWLGFPWDAKGSDVKKLLDTIIESNGYIFWESYSFPNDPKAEIRHRYTSRVKGFLSIRPDAMKYFIVSPCTFEQSARNVNVDFKVWLDIQMHMLATDPDYEGIGGISMWASYYTDPEILRWFSTLVRYYVIEGNSAMLSKQLGYQLYPEILANADWSKNLDYWQISEAAPGSIRVIDRKVSGIKKVYSPFSDHLLQFTEIKGKTNSVRQQLKNLIPGKLYVLRSKVANPETDKYEHSAVQFHLKNVEIISTIERAMHDFGAEKKGPCYDTFTIIFKPLSSDPCELEIADSRHENILEAKTLFLDGVNIAPYFPQKEKIK